MRTVGEDAMTEKDDKILKFPAPEPKKNPRRLAPDEFEAWLHEAVKQAVPMGGINWRNVRSWLDIVFPHIYGLGDVEDERRQNLAEGKEP